MLNPRAFENSRPDGIPVLEIVPGPDQEPVPLFVPLQRTELAGDVAGPLAAMQLTQVFRYTREQCDHVLEAVYRFPLPGDAARTPLPAAPTRSWSRRRGAWRASACKRAKCCRTVTACSPGARGRRPTGPACT